MVSLYQSDSAVGYRQNVSFKDVSPFSITMIKSNPSQATNITTAVSATGSCGIILSQTGTAVAGTTQSFAVNSSYCTANSVVFTHLDKYTGTLSTNGIPVLSVSGITGTQFTINVSNAHSANALAGRLSIGYLIV